MKCPYKYPLRSRAAMADYIEDIGGYHDRWERWPIVFNVKMHWAPDFIEIRRHLEEHIPDSVMMNSSAYGKWMKMAEEMFEQYRDSLWDYAIESMRESVGDDDGYRMLWNDKVPHDIEFSFTGRSGGYLCIDKFDGYLLRGSSSSSLHEDLLLTGADMEWPFDVVRDLYKFCVQWSRDFGDENRKAELIYQMAWALGVIHMESEWDEFADRYFGDGNRNQLSLPLPPQ